MQTATDLTADFLCYLTANPGHLTVRTVPIDSFSRVLLWRSPSLVSDSWPQARLVRAQASPGRHSKACRVRRQAPSSCRRALRRFGLGRRRSRPWSRPPGRAPSFVASAGERRRLVTLALGSPLEVDAVSFVDASVEYRVDDFGFPDQLWPALHGDLTGDQDGRASGARLGNLQQVAPSLGGEALESSVVEDQQVHLGDAPHQAVMGSLVAGAIKGRDHRIDPHPLQR